MTFTAVILAGGRSLRMGRDKAFLSFRGKPLIEQALQVVHEAGAAEVLISGRSGQDFSAFKLPVLLDRQPDCGPLGGLERGLQAAAHPLVFVLAVDLPHMTGDCLRWLLFFAMGRDTSCSRSIGVHRVPDLSDENGDAVKRVPASLQMGVVPVCGGRLEPLAACYPKAAHEIVSAMLREKELAARDFATRCVEGRLCRALEPPGEHAPCFTNWNCPEDVTT